MCRSFYLLFVFVVLSLVADAQYVVKGLVQDGVATLGLPGVNVVARSRFDSTYLVGATTNESGAFELKLNRPGPYVLRLSFVGYVTRVERIRVPQEVTVLQLPPFLLQDDVKTLGEVRIEGLEQRVEQRGDTTEIRADAFKVNPDADAEQLVRKMPGITVENGQVQAQGEQVKRVLLDGQEFFGDDAVMALKNLPAEVVDKIQLIDRLSDQAQFTGFNDGNTEKTLNIITKSGLDNARFGKLYAGYGSDNRYMAGGNINFFKGSKRISLIGMANNINQQNFSSQDLGGLTGSTGGGGRRGGGRPGGGQEQNANFLTGQQGGISITQAVGINYSDNWGKQGKMSASYFVNQSDNAQSSIITRQFFLNDGFGQLYNEQNLSSTVNLNNRFTTRIEYNIDTNNAIIFTPRVSWQGRNQRTAFDGFTTTRGGAPINSTSNEQESDNRSWNVNGDIQYRHRFLKKGRTVSLNVNGDLNSQRGLRDLRAFNEQFGSNPDSVLIDQEIINSSYTQRYRADLVFTEALGEKGMLEFGYAPQIQYNASDQLANNFNGLTAAYDLRDSSISNRFDNNVLSQAVSTRYRYATEKYDWMVGTSYQISNMLSEQSFPTDLVVNRAFYNWLPTAMLRFNLTKSANVRLFYRTNIQLPNLSQLQNVVDNSNTLQLRAGNPELVQSYTHRIGGRYRDAKASKGSSFFVYGSLSLISNEISNSTLITSTDTILPGGVSLVRGAQLIRPLNVDGAYNFRSFASWGFPLKVLKSNLNINAGYTINNLPSLINGNINNALTHNLNSGFTLGSNISKQLDFTVNYTLNYNTVSNSIQPQLNNDYFIHSGGVRFNWIPVPMLVLSADLMYNAFTGLEAGFNQQFTLLNIGGGYRFLKDRRGELRLSVFDLLKQNNSIVRNVTETYVEDVQTEVLQQFFMLTFTYNIRHFRK